MPARGDDAGVLLDRVLVLEDPPVSPTAGQQNRAGALAVLLQVLLLADDPREDVGVLTVRLPTGPRSDDNSLRKPKVAGVQISLHPPRRSLGLLGRNHGVVVGVVPQEDHHGA